MYMLHEILYQKGNQLLLKLNYEKNNMQNVTEMKLSLEHVQGYIMHTWKTKQFIIYMEHSYCLKFGNSKNA